MDPVALLEERDSFRWAVRVAAYNVVVTDAKSAVEAQRAKQKTSSVGGSARPRRVAGRRG